LKKSSRSRRIKVVPFDAARYLNDSSAIAEYLNTILQADDSALLLVALGQVARAKGMSQVARLSGLGRESLYKALAPGSKPQFETISRVVRALGMRIETRAA